MFLATDVLTITLQNQNQVKAQLLRLHVPTTRIGGHKGIITFSEKTQLTTLHRTGQEALLVERFKEGVGGNLWDLEEMDRIVEAAKAQG